MASQRRREVADAAEHMQIDPGGQPSHDELRAALRANPEHTHAGEGELPGQAPTTEADAHRRIAAMYPPGTFDDPTTATTLDPAPVGRAAPTNADDPSRINQAAGDRTGCVGPTGTPEPAAADKTRHAVVDQTRASAITDKGTSSTSQSGADPDTAKAAAGTDPPGGRALSGPPPGRGVSGPGVANEGTAHPDDVHSGSAVDGDDGDHVADRAPHQQDSAVGIEDRAAEPSAAEIRAAVREVLAGDPEVTGVVERLVDDRAHPLDFTRAVRDPQHRDSSLAVVSELADGAVLSGRSLEEYRNTCPGRGPLFLPVPDGVNLIEGGGSRKAAYVAHCKSLDPARRVGADPTTSETALVAGYSGRLRNAVLPDVQAEVTEIAATVDGAVSSRAKNAGDLVDKVQRMTAGSSGRHGRAGYQVGDVIDAVGARITVADTQRLEHILDEVETRFGTGRGGRVLEMENMYAAPKPHNPAYRVVPYVIVTEVDGQPYSFELQVCTRRASIASDLEHNTVYKPYINPSPPEQDRVRAMQAEAAALDQEETRRRHP